MGFDREAARLPVPLLMYLFNEFNAVLIDSTKGKNVSLCGWKQPEDGAKNMTIEDSENSPVFNSMCSYPVPVTGGDKVWSCIKL